jgi:hypothetical protein
MIGGGAGLLVEDAPSDWGWLLLFLLLLLMDGCG